MLLHLIWRKFSGEWVLKNIIAILMVLALLHGTSADLSSLIQQTATSVIERPERAALEPPTVTSLKPPDRNKSGRNYDGISAPGEQSGSHIPPVVASLSPSNNRFNNRRGVNRDLLSSASKAGPVPLPNVVNDTLVFIPQASSWLPPVSYAPPPPRRSHSTIWSSVPENFPRDPRVQMSSSEGVWSNPAGGIWRRTGRHPSSHQENHKFYGHSLSEDTPRRDTFGLQISEDLSHLSSSYSPRRGSAGRGHTLNYSNHYNQEQNSHNMNINNHQMNGDTSAAVQPDAYNGKGTTSPSGSGYDQKLGLAPSLYGSTLYEGQSNPKDETVNNQRTLTLHEILHMLNMTNLDDFKKFLKRKGLKFSQVHEYLNEGASREVFLNYFNEPDSITYDSSFSLSTNMSVATNFDSEDLLESYVHDGTDAEKLHSEDGNNNDNNKSRKNRRMGKNKKRRKNRRKNKNRNNSDKHTIPEFTSTTVVLESDTKNYEKPLSVPNMTVSQTTSLPITTIHITPKQVTEDTLYTSTTNPEPTKLILPEHITRKFLTNEEQLSSSVSVPPLVWSHSSLNVFPTQTTYIETTARRPVSHLEPTTQDTPLYEGKIVIPHTSEVSSSSKTTPLPVTKGPISASSPFAPSSSSSDVSIISFTVMEAPVQRNPKDTVPEDVMPYRKKDLLELEGKQPTKVYSSTKLFPPVTRKMHDEPVIRPPIVKEESKSNYTFPVKGFMIITGIMGALAVFTLVVLISYAIIKCSKQPVVNNYQVSEQKQGTQP